MTEEEKVAAKTAARVKAVEAMAEWAAIHNDEDVVVISWLVIGEVMAADGRRVSWIGGNGNDPTDEEKAGLMRWQIRGLLSEVEAGIQRNEAETT